MSEGSDSPAGARDKSGLDDAQQRSIAVEEIAGAWRSATGRGAGPDAMAAAAIATALSTIVARYGRDTAIAISERFKGQILSGAFDPRPKTDANLDEEA